MTDHTVPDHIVEQWRKEFVEWYRATHLVDVDYVNGELVIEVSYTAMEAWLEARRSLVIKLPEPRSCYDVVRDDRERVYEHLALQGIRVEVQP